MSNALYDYLERLGTLVRAELRNRLYADGLQPVHLDVLSFLARCNRYSNTPLAVAEYLGTTKGTISQSIKQLEAKGLLRKLGNPVDKRMVHLELTDAARLLLEDLVPPRAFRRATESLPPETAQQLERHLETLLKGWQQANRNRSFGLCKTCRFNQPGAGDGFVCGLTQEALSSRDIKLICREHESA